MTNIDSGILPQHKTEIGTILQSYRIGTYIGATMYDSAEIDNILQAYRTGSCIDANFYNKIETGDLLTGKLSAAYDKIGRAHV